MNEKCYIAGRYLMWLLFFMSVFVLTNYNYLGSGVTINEVKRKVVIFFIKLKAFICSSRTLFTLDPFIDVITKMWPSFSSQLIVLFVMLK